LKGSFSPGVFESLSHKKSGYFDFTCRGTHPWKENTHEECCEYPVTLQKNASSVYYPVTISALSIPSGSDPDEIKMKNSSSWNGFINMLENMPDPVKTIKESSNNTFLLNALKNETGISKQKINSLFSKWIDSFDSSPDPDRKPDSLAMQKQMLKEEEYKVLSGRNQVSYEENDAYFERKSFPLDSYNVPFLENVSLITKLREVTVQTGFTRIHPAGQLQADGEKSPKQSSTIVSIRPKKGSWLPAYEAKGEGIFLECSTRKIKEWVLANHGISERANALQKNYENSIHEERIGITPQYLFLHTLAHMLILQLSNECGYNLACLKERIYCSENSKDISDMCGILIYTTDTGSGGTLGGLVRQGYPDILPDIIRKAVDRSTVCANDPLCAMSPGQGRNSLNLAACYACTLLPETSCEELNTFLDRIMLTGMEEKEKGFFTFYPQFL
jgi:hypothetical protein